MRKYAYLIGLSLLMLSCAEQTTTGSREGKGDIQLGGVFRVNEVMDIRSLHPLELTEATGYRIASQVYQSLIRFDQASLEPMPALAERWEPNADATEWTFYLREGVTFHDDACFSGGKGREVVASDVAYCFKQLCTPSAQNQMFWLVRDRLKGAREYYEAALNGQEPEVLECIEVIDDYTLKVKLNFPFASFLRLMGHNAFYVYPREAMETYGAGMKHKAIGTGPFQLKMFKVDEVAVLERNPHYWEEDDFGNSLPYLDAIQITFVKDKKTELLSFRNGELDMIFTLPIEMYDDVMGELNEGVDQARVAFKPQVKPALATHYYAFQQQSEVFKDVRVRKAFNHAIDRESLVTYTLQGEGTPGIYGIVPPVFQNYPHKSIRGIEFSPEKAQAYLAAAGYPNGQGFPPISLEITSGGKNYEIVAEVIQKMLKDNLNIDVNIQVLSMVQQSENAESGRASFWRTAWLADYPDPENFLCLFLGDDMGDQSSSYLNTVNYHSNLYDSLYQMGIRQLDEDMRFRIFSSMDQMLINDAVIMPLYYEEFTRLLPLYVKSFPQNSIEYRDFSRVWIDESLKQN
jgi:oligopeptide transport system substrate-binding protein